MSDVQMDPVSFSGPLLLGEFLNWALFGILSVQVYIYYIAFPRDNFGAQFLVYSVYAIELCQTGIVARDAVMTFGLGFTNPFAVQAMRLSWMSVPVISGIVGCIVQVFYACRISLLFDSKFIGVIIGLLAIIQCAGGVASGVFSYRLNDLIKVSSSHSIRIAQAVMNGTATICDIVIAGFMTYHLMLLRAEMNPKHAVFSKLLKLAIGTGGLTAMLALLHISLYFGYRGANGYFMTPCLAIGKMYSNSMMMVFNSRLQIAGGRRGIDNTDLSLPSDMFNCPPSNSINMVDPHVTLNEGGEKEYNTVSAYQ
ncbi:hypothetical protein BDQ17DRAFT_1298347 [Cyathus striatus]|nr:hypothetical protein BDQ17DRAFT_1298347 [Cyathus striatus]